MDRAASGKASSEWERDDALSAGMKELDAGVAPRFAAWFGRRLASVNSVWFRYRLRGIEHIPSGPVLFVGNHSGIGIVDAVCLMGVSQTTLAQRNARAMMHDAFVAAPVIGRIARAFGAVRAERAAARAALEKGYDVVCFPGGNLDSCRPATEHRKVVFGGRRGYVRLALEAGVPIVPMVTLGSHFTYLLMPGGAMLGRLTRSAGWLRSEIIPIPLATVGVLASIAMVACGLPWWLLALALVALVVPTPARVTTEILAPIDVAASTRHIADPEERVELAHRLVLGAIAKHLASMTHEQRGAGAALKYEEAHSVAGHWCEAECLPSPSRGLK